MPSFEVQRRIAAPRDRVWALLSDPAGWERWAGLDEVVVQRVGDPPPAGPGTARVLRRSGLAVEEEVVAFEPPERLAWSVVGGLPVSNHHSEIRLRPDGAGTSVVWQVRFEARIPLTGRLLRAGHERWVRGVLDRLARTATGG